MTVTPICRSNCLSRPSAVRLLQDESCASRINDLLVVPEYPAAASTICNGKWWCRSFTVFFPSVCVSLTVITVLGKVRNPSLLRIAAPKMLFAPVWCCRSCRSYRSCHFLVVFVAFLGDLCYLWLCVLINTFVRTCALDFFKKKFSQKYSSLFVFVLHLLFFRGGPLPNSPSV